MVPNIEIISKEIIKPSTPTPNHLKTHNLSVFDQIAPPVFFPIIFFYQHRQRYYSDNIKSDCVHSLKQSLSEILTTFYPLAGRIGPYQNPLFVICDDSGVDFIEARVRDQTITRVVEDPNMEELKLYLPFDPILVQDMEVMLAVKVSFFDDGGISVGVCVSHKIGDGASLCAFMNEWAKSAISNTEMDKPSFDLSMFFPSTEFPAGFTNVGQVAMSNESLVTKRFIFDKEKLKKLKNDVASDITSDPTRVEALSAFLWKYFIEIAKAKKGKNVMTMGLHVVNLRPRTTNVPRAEAIFGNFLVYAFALLSDSDNSLGDIATKLRVGIKNRNGNTLEENKGLAYLDEYSKHGDLIAQGAELSAFTSWCRFPFYEVDFGWGKPIWVCTTTAPFKNFAVLMSTPCGEGIEAWVNLTEEDMINFTDHYTQTFMI